MLVEITTGKYKGRIGELLTTRPHPPTRIFDTVEVIVGAISCYTELVYIPPGDWKIP